MINKFQKNTLLNYLLPDFQIENDINSKRIFEVNNKEYKKGTVVYLIEREIRLKDNFALQFAIKKASELQSKLKIVYKETSYENKSKKAFIERQILSVKQQFDNANLDFEILDGKDFAVLEYLKELDTALLIIDFNPISNKKYLKDASFKIIEIDGHNIIPARFLSEKREYNARTIRRKIYANIKEFLTEYPNKYEIKTEAEIILKDFIKNKLPFYAEYKNNPTKNVISGLSKYLNLGFISKQRVALEILKSEVSVENKEAFLEELIVRSELSDNFCLYCKKYKGNSCLPNWAKNSIFKHKNDFKPYIYTKKEFENAKTHDKLWNATQLQLREKGVIHGYLRMYWAKKISEWSANTKCGIEIAIELNDKYAFDAPSPNGYTGILWSIGGLHDRAFQDRDITGKIRTMTYNSICKKFDVEKYIQSSST